MANSDEFYDDDDEELGEEEGYHDESLSTALMRQWGAAPWYVSSLFIHMVIFALLLFFTPDPVPKKEKPKIQTSMDEEIIEEPEEPEEEPEITPETPEEVEVDVTTDTQFENVEITDIDEQPQEDVLPQDTVDFADTNDPIDAPNTFGLTSAFRASGKGGKFTGRVGPKRGGLVRKGGGSTGGQLALNRGLVWLAKTQENDGSWNCSKYEGGNHDISVASLAALAFLGAGNSSKDGKFRKNVRSAQDYLLRNLDQATGRIGRYRYEAGITLMAMAEAWAMSEDKSLASVVQGQVDDALMYQGSNGGWGYYPLYDRDPVKGHVDTSVTGWWMMGLKSAMVAGANVDRNAMENVIGYLRTVASQGEHSGIASAVYQTTDRRHQDTMTPVSLTCLQFLGVKRDDPLVQGNAEWLMQHPEYMISMQCKTSTPYYGWYYQALGFFQLGTKSPQWRKFAPDMEKVLLAIQHKGGFNDGSWPPIVPWQNKAGYFEVNAGRVGTTAIGCLMLEVYYRYAEGEGLKKK